MRRHVHRPLISLLSALILLLVALAPVSAAPPEQVAEPEFLIFPDVANGVVVFWNVTRDNFCAWEASGFMGEPPAEELLVSSLHQVKSGPVIRRASMTSNLELWTLDEGADLSGPCTDTDDSTEPWATGSARVSFNDNDLFHDESLAAGVRRTNAFSERGGGTVMDADGNRWHYHWIFHGVFDNEGDFRPIEKGFLTPIG